MLKHKEADPSPPVNADAWASTFHAAHESPAMAFAVARPDGLAPEFGWHGPNAGYRLSDVQAQAILDLRLQRLTGLEQDKIRDEYKEVMANIADQIGRASCRERV